MDENAPVTISLSVLEDMNARDVLVLDVQNQSDFTDYMIIATGTSSRHVAALVENIALRLKQETIPVLGIEGDRSSTWVLIDLGEVILNVMQSDAREFYALETLWSSGDGSSRRLTQP